MNKPASSPRRPRRAALTDPTTRMRLAEFLFVRGKKSLLRRYCGGGLELLAEARAAHETARARRADELTVVDEHGAAQEDVLGRADDLGALVEAVIALRMVRRGRDRLPPLGVEDDEVGVRSDRDRPLARIEPEQLRRLGCEDVDHAVEADPPLTHAEVVDHLQ